MGFGRGTGFTAAPIERVTIGTIVSKVVKGVVIAPTMEGKLTTSKDLEVSEAERIEEQTEYNRDIALATGYQEYAGQKLTISNRTVKKLGFWIKREGTPTGDVTFEIRKVSDDSLICSEVWGQAEDLTTIATYKEVEFDTPQTINEEARILVYSPGDPYGNNVRVGYLNDDVKADEFYTYGKPGAWTDKTLYDFAYRYYF